MLWETQETKQRLRMMILSVFKLSDEDAMMVMLVMFHSKELETYLC